MGDDLTTQQKSRLRRAFRETFDAEDHGQAVKGLYERFSELYGVSADALRAIVAEDLKRKPHEYSELRRKLAVRQATKRGQETLHRAAAGPQNQQSARPKAEREKPTPAEKATLHAKCPSCGNKVRLESNGKLAKHRAYGAVCGARTADPKAWRQQKRNKKSYGGEQRSKATCAVCMKKLGVRQTDGRMLAHNHKGQRCNGSGRSPFEGRGGKFMKGLEIRTVVSGGLPGLGRHH